MTDFIAKILIQIWSRGHMNPKKSFELYRQHHSCGVGTQVIHWDTFLEAWKKARAHHDLNMRDELYRLGWIWKAKGRSILSGCTKYVRHHCPHWTPVCQMLAVLSMARAVEGKRR